MLKLSAKDNVLVNDWQMLGTAILRVTKNPHHPQPLRQNAALLINRVSGEIPTGFRMVLIPSDLDATPLCDANILRLSPALDYLADGDVIRISPPSKISTLYRRGANANSLLVTERCNSFCVMCSQPPKDIDDSHLVQELLDAIPLFDRGSREIGITGGEPTLLGEGLFSLVRTLKASLPETAVHILSNGRNFKELDLAQRLATIRHADLMVGIPIYSDVPAIHDFVVQADNAFDETIRGILNLKRCLVRVEIRVVIHRATFERLPALAHFISRNLQFVDQVVLMGMEVTGFAKANLSALWIDPVDYQDQLREAAEILAAHGIRVAVYNHQLCVLHPATRRFAVKSISDWKNEYVPECTGCELMSACGGFFSTSQGQRSAHIHAVKEIKNYHQG